jgi:hypothetical protein
VGRDSCRRASFLSLPTLPLKATAAIESESPTLFQFDKTCKMRSHSFFIPGVCKDPGYQNVRDLPHWQGARDFTESLWRRYQGYEDEHFLREAKDNFLARFWEMYLAVTFIERRFRISRVGNAGPEFCFTSGTQKIWVEAVTPRRGIGGDSVPELLMGSDEACEVPTEKILLRYTNVLTEKRKQYLVALAKGIVNESDCFVLAINSRGIPHAPYGNTLPFFVQALLPFGNLAVLIDPKTGDSSEPFYQRREEITKANGFPVSTAGFLDPEFAFVSLVLHSAVDCANHPAKLGGDFTILHNPSTSRALGHSVFDWCEQLIYHDGALQKVHSI